VDHRPGLDPAVADVRRAVRGALAGLPGGAAVVVALSGGADSLALAQALSAAASPYELHVMEGLPHGFMQMSALEGCRAAMRLMWDFVARNV